MKLTSRDIALLAEQERMTAAGYLEKLEERKREDEEVDWKEYQAKGAT